MQSCVLEVFVCEGRCEVVWAQHLAPGGEVWAQQLLLGFVCLVPLRGWSCAPMGPLGIPDPELLDLRGVFLLLSSTKLLP